MIEPCRHEVQVIRAVAEDRWTQSLREHVTECADCAAAAAAAPFMTRIARIDQHQPKLPEPSVVWFKAQLLKGSAVADRVTRPLNIIQIIAYAVVAAGWAGVLTWRWSDLQRWLLTFTPARMVERLTENSSLSISFLLMVVILASMTVMLALHTILAED